MTCDELQTILGKIEAPVILLEGTRALPVGDAAKLEAGLAGKRNARKQDRLRAIPEMN